MPDSWKSVSKSPHGSVLKFAELSLVRLAAGILIFSDGTELCIAFANQTRIWGSGDCKLIAVIHQNQLNFLPLYVVVSEFL